ncbi:MAG: hypothetical protein KatS3mg082_1788 [Nitrospiraceae bacterium]|nr:MAG: hypothetical protein KatS3mg082_1788 [Nitrospiraceae bacterium]
MLTFLTETGRRITAASLQDAEAIASEFNLGRIIDSAPRKRRAAKAAAPSQYIIWDELCLSVRAHGLTNVAAYMAAEALADERARGAEARPERHRVGSATGRQKSAVGSTRFHQGAYARRARAGAGLDAPRVRASGPIWMIGAQCLMGHGGVQGPSSHVGGEGRMPPPWRIRARGARSMTGPTWVRPRWERSMGVRAPPDPAEDPE